MPRFLHNHPEEAALVDAVAQRYGCRASTVLRGSWVDYMLDVAVLQQALQHQERTKDQRPAGAQTKPDLSKTPETFADPLQTLPNYGNVGPVRTMAIPEDGIW